MDKFNLKKAAMFGLDARIALAIFGALSVISGAALYSAIKTAKAEQYRQFFIEIVKATEQYYLDVGSPLPQKAADVLYTDIIENRASVNNWKGPYIEGTNVTPQAFSNNVTKTISSSANIQLLLLKPTIWPNITSWQVCDIGSPECSLWVRFEAGNNATGKANLEKIFPLLDSAIDNNDGDKAGNIRLIFVAPYNYSILYKGVPLKRTS